MLVAVASNLENDASLVAATHVCHLWRTILLSSPCLWTHLDFANETRALVFLERSKLASLRVDMTCGYPLEIAEELFPGPLRSRVLSTFFAQLPAKNLIPRKCVTCHTVTSLITFGA